MTIENEKPTEAPAGHTHCFMCGSRNPRSLGLEFRAVGEDGVAASVRACPELQGYDGLLHGGAIAAILDSAMTHCLSRRGISAITGDLHVRFLHPVSCDGPLEVRARTVLHRPPLYRAEAELLCNELVMARAEATFMNR